MFLRPQVWPMFGPNGLTTGLQRVVLGSDLNSLLRCFVMFNLWHKRKYLFLRQELTLERHSPLNLEDFDW